MRKILILGHARHGKDTVAEMLRDELGLRFEASSMIVAEKIFHSTLGAKYGYKTVEECFEDRVNHRTEWHEWIKDYNKRDRARVAKSIFEHNDIYVGLRDYEELEAVIEAFDPIIVWVDASKRLPLEAKSSMNIEQDHSWHTIDNNGGLFILADQVFNFAYSSILDKWDQRYAELLKIVKTWSKDPDCQVGALVASPDNHSISTGYNGFARGIADDHRLASVNKNDLAVHAEVNAILNARASVQGWSLYATKALCARCANFAIQAGIAEVQMPKPDPHSGWYYQNNLAIDLLHEANIRVIFNPCLNDIE